MLWNTFSHPAPLHTYTHHCLPLPSTPGTHCYPGPLQRHGELLGAGLVGLPEKDEQTACTEPCGLRWPEHGQGRGNMCVHPSQAKARPSAGGSWGCMKALVFLLNSHEEGQWTCDGLSTQWGDMPRPHSSASFAASSLNTASSRQVPWKHPPPSMSHLWSTASLVSAFGNLFTLAEVDLLQGSLLQVCPGL